MIPFPITILFWWSGPTNVTWFVVATLVGVAVYRVFGRRAWANISQKIHKPIATAPSITYGNSLTSVVFIGRPIRVITAIIHRRPTSIFRRLNGSTRMAMLVSANTTTAAFSRIGRCQGVGRNNGCNAAIAFTIPTTVPSFIASRVTQDSEKVKSFSRQIVKVFNARMRPKNDRISYMHDLFVLYKQIVCGLRGVNRVARLDYNMGI